MSSVQSESKRMVCIWDAPYNVPPSTRVVCVWDKDWAPAKEETVDAIMALLNKAARLLRSLKSDPDVSQPVVAIRRTLALHHLSAAAKIVEDEGGHIAFGAIHILATPIVVPAEHADLIRSSGCKFSPIW